MGLITQLILGAVGGNIGGALFKNLSLGALGNSIAGIVGSGLGAQVLSAAFGPASGGIVLMAVLGFIKKVMAK
jgi:uncharacterized membrane protein YeaQ/YmgE (transglycosylase-associated protein family)